MTKIMTPQQILEKAIGLAIAGGWSFFDYADDDEFSFTVTADEECQGGLLVTTVSSIGEYGWHPNIIIFNREFARALWGENRTYIKRIWIEPTEVFHDYKADGSYSYKSQRPGHYKNQLYRSKPWWWHLQQMVIADDPITYLGEHLPEEVNHE
jgi:hypothetical protein